MAINTITYSNKVTLNENTSVADVNKCKAADMNEIKNVVNANATLLGNLQMVKLWENENPTSSFAAQTITLSSADYDYLIWFYGFYTSNLWQTSSIVLKTDKISLFVSRDHGISGTYYSGNYWRDITTSNYKDFDITTCSIKYGNNTSTPTSNSYLIPLAVYGGKFS